MGIHQDILEIVNKRILPEVVRVHQMDVPYPAELWVNGNCEHQDGAAMFSIGDEGSLNAEYFGYDNADRMLSETMGPRPVSPKLVMKDTQVEIPVWHLSSSYKARTMYSIPMPAVQAYSCAIRGWIGGSDDTQMQSATITLLDLPDLRLSKSHIRIPEENTLVEAVTMRGLETKNAVLTLEAGDWKIQLTEGSTDWRQESEPLYHATLTKKVGSPFTLSDDETDNGIINALYKFLSFQCGKWINIPTIVCNPVFSVIEKKLRYDDTNENLIHEVHECLKLDTPDEIFRELKEVLCNTLEFEDVADADISSVSTFNKGYASISFSKGNPYLERVRVNKLSPRNTSNRSSWTVSEWQEWPDLYKEFWKRHNRNPRHLNNAIHHYVSCSEIFENSSGIDFATVAARSTLEALIRWWNNLPEEYEFHGEPERQFAAHLMKAADEAKLGKDVGRQIDMAELESVVARASQFRNRIDHGRAGNVDADEMQRIIAHQQYMHNLARLFILAKLGLRNTDARGSYYAPAFKEMQP